MLASGILLFWQRLTLTTTVEEQADMHYYYDASKWHDLNSGALKQPLLLAFGQYKGFNRFLHNMDYEKP